MSLETTKLNQCIINGGMPCQLQTIVDLSQGDKIIYPKYATVARCRYVYVPKNQTQKQMIFSSLDDVKLNGCFERLDFNFDVWEKFANDNYRTNYIQVKTWKNNREIKFIPPEFTLRIFPSSEMKNYYYNNNHFRWGELVKQIKFNQLKEPERSNILADLMKIYYALGGFASVQNERDEAFNYVLYLVVPYLELQVNQIKTEIINQNSFSQFELRGAYNPSFAKFFKKYFFDNHDFMKFDFYDGRQRDYLAQAHNSFNKILKCYPNRVVNGNFERELLTPEFVAKHCIPRKYQNVNRGNEDLALTIAPYGYPQKQFNMMQKIFNQAKNIKDQAVMRAETVEVENDIVFRILAKDDPLGFVLGDITNCCQTIDGMASECVKDGYTNPNSGFLVFEKLLRNQQGELNGEKQILGQSYVWYDAQTQTVCYDSVEIPHKAMKNLRTPVNANQATEEVLMNMLVNSIDALMKNLRQNNVVVKNATIGVGNSNLNRLLREKFELDLNPACRHDYHGYTDSVEQFLIRSEHNQINKLSKNILTTEISKANLCEIKNHQTLVDKA